MTEANAIDFTTVRRIVESGSPDDTALRYVDRLISAALIVSPVVLGPVAAIPLLALFDMKSDMVAHIRDIARRLAGGKGDFLDRSRSLAAAHWLITYSAYFEAANALLGVRFDSDEVRAAARFCSVERAGPAIAVTVSESAVRAETDPSVLEYAGLPPVSLPHPASTFRTEADDRLRLYREMTSSLQLSVESVTERARGDGWGDLPALAVEFYQAQYLELMLDHQDFFGYALLYEQVKTQEIAIAASDEVRLAQEALQGIDHGLSRLSAAIAALGQEAQAASGARKTARMLHLNHQAEAAKPVFAARSTGLTFPSRVASFIPQAYQAVVYSGDDIRLEHEQTWQDAPVRDDLGGFLVRYLTSGYSAETPLVLLGHPGSGKSLLTRVLAAELLPPKFTTVRIELRHIDPGDDLQTQIERQIRADTGRKVDWADFAEELAGEPPVIILDGYDELLQSTGQVHAGYLRKAQEFQERELRYDRPARVIITSRITLVDKATVPLRSTVVRLHEFDESRREKWAEVWNRANQQYFLASGVREFAVPTAEKLLELAKQPLLLLMLALYDSAANELASEQIDQTLLYHNLLARFVRREREKDENRPVVDDALVEKDMHRLAVVAIGMFNRQAVKAQRPEINDDLAYFKAERSAGTTADGAHLSQADLLLGSFFFVHESQGRTGDRDDPAQGRSSAFEFLHNTFGEFLAAEFIVTTLIKNARLVARLEDDDELAETLDAHCADPKASWFATFAFTPLNTRPVIVEMIREWLPHRAERAGFTVEEVAEAARRVIDRQLLDIATRKPPAWFLDEIDRAPYPGRSLLGQLAFYTFNLVVVGAVTQREGYWLPQRDPSRAVPPWTGLTHLWRGCFTPDGLLGAAAILEAARSGDRHGVRAREHFFTPPSRSLIETRTIVAGLLGDDVEEGVFALATGDFHGVEARLLEGAERALGRAGLKDRHWSAATWEQTVLGAERLSPGDAPGLAHRAEAPMSGFELQVWEVLEAGGLSEATVDVLGPIGLDGVDALAGLTRYQVAKMVAVKAGADFRWLQYVMERLSDRPLHTIVARPIVAGLLRAARRAGSWPLVDSLVFALLRMPPADVPVEVAVELVLLGEAAPWRDDADRLLAGALTDYGQLRFLPDEAMVALLLAMTDQGRAPESAERMRDLLRGRPMPGMPGWSTPFTRMLATSIFEEREASFQAQLIGTLHATNRNTRYFLALLRVARTKADPEMVVSALRDGTAPHARDRFTDPSRLQAYFGVESMDGLRDRLTVRQMDDLSWLVDQIATEEPAWDVFRGSWRPL